jgi:hypothetical protein
VPVTVATQVAVCAVVMEAGVATTETPVTVTVGGAAVTAMFAEPDTLVKPACAEWAVQVPVPAPEGVKMPPAVMVPPVAVHVTAVLNAPVPVTVATQLAVCAVVMEAGFGTTETPVTVTVGGVVVTAMFAEPKTFVNPAWAEWAVHVPAPAPEGVKTPPAEMAPPVAVQVTAVL